MVAVSILSGVSGQRRQRTLFALNNETVSGMGLAYLAEKWKYGGGGNKRGSADGSSV